MNRSDARETAATERAARFDRQARFAALGAVGQERLARSRVLVVGLGALGSHAATWLVRAGIGHLWLVDRDVVELGNLQRQVLYDEDDARAGRPKAIAAAAHLAAVDAACALEPLAEHFTADTFARLDERPDLIVDGTDNWPTRLLLNDLAVRERIPWVYGGVLGAAGAAAAMIPGTTPCLRCLLPEPPQPGELPTCETTGVLAPAVAMVAAFQVAQALKVLSGNPDAVARGVLQVDVWGDRYELRGRATGPTADCPACARGEFPWLEPTAPEPAVLCGRDAVQVWPHGDVALGPLAARLAAAGAAVEVQSSEHLLRFRADGHAFSVFPGGRTLVFGTSDPRRALALYDRWIGA